MSNGLVLVTGSCGLVGFETSLKFLDSGYEVAGVDNNMREFFFGPEASVAHNIKLLSYHRKYKHWNYDLRNEKDQKEMFKHYGDSIKLIVHTAAQPSHDWAVKDPLCDFDVNARSTLLLLENFRQHCPNAGFIFTSTNKVYGDSPNRYMYEEQEKRYDLNCDHRFYKGFGELLSIDHSKHSIFGASKLAADIMVQEYGKYFDLHTVCFRGGCLTGPRHKGAKLHGFLSYLIKCLVNEKPYTILGYKGKQVRDNIHVEDLVGAFKEVFNNMGRIKGGKVFNIGGGELSNCSILEAIELGEGISGKKLDYQISDKHRSGDHKWWISDISSFKETFPEWKQNYNIKEIIQDIIDFEVKQK